jgi:hypothetical protein
VDATANENWLPIPGHPGYEVSDLGRVRSLGWVTVDTIGRRQPHRAQMLTPCTRPGRDYLHVSLGAGVNRPVHHLVLSAFVGTRPAGLDGCHNDGDPTNNRVSNLRWDTKKSNSQDVIKHGNSAMATKRVCLRNHPLFPPNLSAANLRAGTRACLACMRARTQISNLRSKGKPVPDLQTLSDQYYEAIMAASHD